MNIELICRQCKTPAEATEIDALCPHCTRGLFPFATDDFKERLILNQCPVCGSAHLFRQKDFNRKLGIAILIAGIALAYFTYGISLLAVTFIDWFLYKKVGEIGCCYQCHSVFRSIPSVSSLGAFDLILHDHYRSREGSPLQDEP